MAQYYFATKLTSKGNVRSDTDLNTLADNEIGIGVGDAVSFVLNYSTVTSITTAIHKLLNSARDRHYPALTGVRHYRVSLAGSKDQVVDSLDYANVAGAVSLAIGEDFGSPNHGTDDAMGYYGSVLIDAQAKILMNVLLDNFLNTGSV